MIAAQFHWVRAFAWARAFPDEAQVRMGELARCSTAPLDDRELACRMLGVLAEEGRRGSEEALVAVASVDTGMLSRIATYALVRADTDGRHRPLYWMRARRHDDSAIEALSCWPDSASRRVLEEVISASAGNPDALREVMPKAEWALRRLEWASGSDWEALVRARLQSRPDRGETAWALRVARSRRLPDLSVLIRDRLSWAEEQAADRAVLENRALFENRDLYEADRDYGVLLETFHALGEALSPLQERSLCALGRGGDPRLLLLRSN